MVELFTTGPAGVLGLKKGTLEPGADADITVLEIDRPITVDPAEFRSRSANSPFLGWKLRGAPVVTLVGGRVVHDVR
jgi:dihydroorotase